MDWIGTAISLADKLIHGNGKRAPFNFTSPTISQFMNGCFGSLSFVAIFTFHRSALSVNFILFISYNFLLVVSWLQYICKHGSKKFWISKYTQKQIFYLSMYLIYVYYKLRLISLRNQYTHFFIVHYVTIEQDFDIYRHESFVRFHCKLQGKFPSQPVRAYANNRYTNINCVSDDRYTKRHVRQFF